MLSPSTIALRALTSLPPSWRQKLGQERQVNPEDLPLLPEPNRAVKNLLIAPANSAGQAKQWAAAASEVPGWTGVNMTYRRSAGFAHDSDSAGLESAVVYSPQWAKRLRKLVVADFSAVIYESLFPLFGSLYFQDAVREIRYLQRHGVKTAVLWHGSDIRSPHVHRATTVGSVFASAPAKEVDALTQMVANNAKRVEKVQVQTFVSTPDLLQYQPEATWLPLVVAREFLAGPVVASDSRVPTVLHLPSRGYLKGTAKIAAQMQDLADQGVIHYLQPERVPHAEVRRLVESSDIVVDQIGMDAYGVAALEALSLGKVVVGQVGGFVRDAVHARTGWQVPVQEANAQTLTSVVSDLAADPAKRVSLAPVGREYVQAVHSPTRAAHAMTPFLQGLSR